MDYNVVVKPLKATFLVKEEVQDGVFKPRGIACAVCFKGQIILLTSSAVVEATDNRKKHIAERFSRKHFGDYRLDVSILGQHGNFTFLRIVREYPRVNGAAWVISLNLELPSSERKALGRPLRGTGEFELQVQWDGNSTNIQVNSTDSRKYTDWTLILGVPIIIKNIQNNKKQSGRFSVIGVVGLTSEEKFCLCYLDHENTGSLGMLLSKQKRQRGPTNIKELVEEETSTAPAQAVAASINLNEQGPSAILETEDQRSWREYGETSTAPAQAIAAINLREQGPSASLETEDQRSWRECGGIDHVQPVSELEHMAAVENDSRLLLCRELEAIRSKIVRGELVLFVGEQLSTLVTPENQSPSLDDWWQIVTHPSEDGIKALLDLEEKFFRRLQLAPSRVHNVLRNVGNFPLIITTNMDELLERFLWKPGNRGEKMRLDQISCLANSWPDPRRDVVIKCLGDASFNARVLPSSKKYFEDFCDSQENAEVEFMRQLFNERSILFLGCDSNRVEYMNFFQKFAVNAKEMKHYKFETHSKSDLGENGNLLTLKANLQPWEFVQFLSTGTIEEKIQPGKVYERSYLRLQRAEYLQQQLALEKTASEIVFHTISITNALSPDDFFEQVSLPTIQNIFTQDPFGVYSEDKVQRTMAAMKARRDNLIKMIEESKTNVTALFFYHGVKNEIELWKKEAESEEEKQKNLKKCKISIRKYAKAILLCKSFLRNKSSLEIRIVGDQDTYKVQEVERETFALIRLKGGQDEAICYAETATSPQSRKFANHLININGEEVLNKRRIYERSRANAWSNEDSIFKLANALIKENDEIQQQGFGISAIDVSY